VQQHIKNFFEEKFPDGNCKPLLALSGGVDSMVLAHLFLASKIPFEAAHVNFGLRGEESDGDEKMVKSYCRERGILLLVKRVDAQRESLLLKTGIQETARALRYRWFRQLLSERKLTHIFTAHHKDDQAETMLFNFIRGTGINGLYGMKEVDGDLVRPLLSISKKEVLDYARHHKIKYREDSSNASVKYSRNRIRLNVMNELHEINPGLSNTLFHSSKIYHEAARLIHQSISDELGRKLRIYADRQVLEIAWLSGYSFPRLLLWHWLKSAGFTSLQMEDVLDLLTSQPGKFVESTTYRLLRDREFLLLHQKKANAFIEVPINENDAEILQPVHLIIEKKTADEISFNTTSPEAWLDIDTLTFPLVVRRWREGDRFQPQGMKGSKKISDFMVSQRLSSLDKDFTFVLESAGEIAWLIGHRISEKFRITNLTQQALHLVLTK